jgi:hypothetical protein
MLSKYPGKWEINEEKPGLFKAVKSVDEHARPFSLHSLRHLRATELRKFYHFRPDELAAYCGWTLQSVEKVTSVMQRYQDLSMDYLDYFPKLLRERVA